MTQPQIKWTQDRLETISPEVLHDVFRLRQDVFILEQQCLYADIDGLDADCWHICGLQDNVVKAYLRAVPPGLVYPAAALGRLVVDPSARGQTLGDTLLRQGIALCRSLWPDAGITISAQAPLRPWYQKQGFVTEGAAYDEDGIPHIKMHYRPTE